MGQVRPGGSTYLDPECDLIGKSAGRPGRHQNFYTAIQNPAEAYQS